MPALASAAPLDAALAAGLIGVAVRAPEIGAFAALRGPNTDGADRAALSTCGHDYLLLLLRRPRRPPRLITPLAARIAAPGDAPRASMLRRICSHCLRFFGVLAFLVCLLAGMQIHVVVSAQPPHLQGFVVVVVMHLGRVAASFARLSDQSTSIQIYPCISSAILPSPGIAA